MHADSLPDSTDISQMLYLGITRQENIRQFNRLIGVCVTIAADSLRKGNPLAAERVIVTAGLPVISHYGDSYNTFHAFMVLGRSYYQQKKYTQSKWFFIQSNTTAKKIGYGSGELFSLLELAKVKEAINDDKLALSDYKLAAALAARMKFTTTLTQIRKNILKLSTSPKTANAELFKPQATLAADR
ncbi:hypothetical protein [Hufsiella ginkgonis]|uniref:Uncharacterized protein n=1 Tax=Hufsiella ginkgonis TaxID=2695274 RepID=A0A7K1XUR2_9SPHI|nr:hypothetical protein [Hufsiella ginkgonis]MXV14226.1 hypothetical protein [Hufsiella ginkgonis]